MISIRVELINGTYNIVSPATLRDWIREDKVKKFYWHINQKWAYAKEYNVRDRDLSPEFKERRRDLAI